MITHSLNTRRSNSEINSDLTMIPTYAELIQDRPVINEAYSLLTKNPKMNVTRDDIAEAVKTDTKPQSLIISIKATTDNKDKSILIANTTAAAAKNIIPKILQLKVQRKNSMSYRLKRNCKQPMFFFLF